MMRELPGIFRRLVHALHARIKRGDQYLKTSHPDDEQFRLASNRTAQWLAERTRPDATGTERSACYTKYRTWCEQNGAQPLGRNRFLASVRAEGVDEHKPQGKGWHLKVVLVDPDKVHPVGSSEAVVGGFGSSGPTLPIRLSQNDDDLGEALRPGLPRTAESADKPPIPASRSAVLPFDLETESADRLFVGSSGFIRIAHSTEGSGVGHIADALHSGRPIAAHNGFGFDFQALGIDVAAEGDAGRLIDTQVLGLLDHPPLGRRSAGQVLRDYSASALAGRYELPGKTGDIRAMAKKHGGFDAIRSTTRPTTPTAGPTPRSWPVSSTPCRWTTTPAGRCG